MTPRDYSIGRTNIDDQIREEIERIARVVIDWTKSKESTGSKLHWRPRFAKDAFTWSKKRISPQNVQTYYDLQLSRGASRPMDPDLNWEFEDPKVGTTLRRLENEERIQHFFEYYALHSTSMLLELGTRSGHFIYFLRSKGYLSVVGMDCVKLNVLWCLKNGLDVKQADAHELSQHFHSDSFDAIFAYHVLEHCYDPEKVLDESWTILKHGGGIHIEIPISGLDMHHAHCYSFSRREVGKMLRRSGFKLLDYKHKGALFGGMERVVAQKI